MNPEIKKKWLQKLRSGVYLQGVECLHEGNTYCCLGVLCEVHMEETDGDWDLYEDGVYSYMEDTSTLSKELKEWAGLSTRETEDLISLNDDDGKSFLEIADSIEEKL